MCITSYVHRSTLFACGNHRLTHFQHAGNATELADALAEAARAPITSFIRTYSDGGRSRINRALLTSILQLTT